MVGVRGNNQERGYLFREYLSYESILNLEFSDSIKVIEDGKVTRGKFVKLKGDYILLVGRTDDDIEYKLYKKPINGNKIMNVKFTLIESDKINRKLIKILKDNLNI